MELDKLADAFSKIGNYTVNSSELFRPQIDFTQFAMPEIEPINMEETIFGDIKRKVEEQNKLASQQIDMLAEQNALLSDNYNKLKSLYDVQVEANNEANEELRESRRYNRWMMVIAIIAMLAAIAGPVVTLMLS